MLKTSRVVALASAVSAASLMMGTTGVASAAEIPAPTSEEQGDQVSDSAYDEEIAKIEKMTDSELKEIGQEQARKQIEGDTDSEITTQIGWPSHTFSHETTVRLWDAAKTGGVGAVSVICGAVTPGEFIAKAAAGGFCAAVAYFLADIPSIPDNQCLNANIRLQMKLQEC